MLKILYIILLFISSTVLASDFEEDIIKSAIERTHLNIQYDGSYFSLAYPNGDVPENLGVCTDVIIRTYRKMGTDLQKLVHEDMLNNFKSYPSQRIWGLNKPDKNIDHRRVPNLQSFFKRQGRSLKVSNKAVDYKPGNLVTWMLPGNLPHIGIVTDRIDKNTGNPLIVHNIGSGPKLEEMLFSYKISGHYRFVPEKYKLSSNAE